MIRAAVWVMVGLIPACEADETVARYGAADITWTLTDLNGAPFDARATIRFAPGGAVSGQAPCNTYATTNTIPYPWFGLDPIAATRMACPDLGAEQAYFDALMAMTQSEVRQDALFLRNDDGGEMVFTPSD